MREWYEYREWGKQLKKYYFSYTKSLRMASPKYITSFFDALNSLISTLNNFTLLNRRYLDNDKDTNELFKNLITRLQVIQHNATAIDDSRMLDFTDNLKTIDTEIIEIVGKEINNTVSEEKFTQIFRRVRNLYRYTNYIWDILFKESDNDTLRAEIEALKSKTEQDAHIISELKNRMEIELKEFDERYRDNLGNYELLAQEKIFRDVALSDHYEGKKWIWYIAGLTIILLGLSTWFMYSCWLDFACLFSKKSIGNFNNTEEWQVLFYYELFKPVAIRVFILSVIILLLKFALKNYNSLMHNKIVNMHKANSLAAMIRVINSLSDENTRTTLINLAGKEIFMHQKTGYLRKDDNKIDLGIIEKLASILQKKE